MDSYPYSDGRWQHLLTAKSCGFIYYMSSLKCFRALQSFLCFIALSQLLSIYEQCKYVNPTLSICPALPSALPMSMYPISMSESIPSLEIDSSVPFFQILYICSVMSQRGRMGQWVGERFKKKGRWEGESGWGTHVNPWLIHVNVQQKPLQYCKVISLQLIKINEKTKKQKKGIYTCIELIHFVVQQKLTTLLSTYTPIKKCYILMVIISYSLKSCIKSLRKQSFFLPEKLFHVFETQ